MDKLKRYAAESRLMNIRIRYGEDVYSFNLYKELIVDENKINNEIKDQPSGYAFLGMLHKKLIRKAKDRERELEKIYAQLFVNCKKKIDPSTGKLYSNDVVKEMVILDSQYGEALKIFLKAQDDRDDIETCVRSFEERKDLIQTLSANIRKTN